MHRTHIRVLLAIALIVGVVAAVSVFYSERDTSDVENFDDTYDLVLKDYDGGDIELSQFRGGLLVVHSWATWCPYCEKELLNFARLKDTYPTVQILAINRGEDARVADTFTARLGVAGKLVVLLDSTDSFYREIGGYAMPETVFIDERGEIIFHQRGPLTLEELVKKVNELLQE